MYQINNLRVDASFRDFLISSHNKINRMILCVESIQDSIDFISPSDKDDMIFYLPKNKLIKCLQNDIDPFSERAGRVRMKIGRLVSKLYTKQTIEEFKITIQDVELFVNDYKSFFNTDNLEIKIVEGKEIKTWYDCRNYSQIENGTLWKSCMRYPEKLKFLKLYISNKDAVKMLVLLDKNKDGEVKLRARALLWQDVKTPSSTIKVMDRIYSIYDSDVYIFTKWARDNGYICKAYQNSKSHTLFQIDSQIVELKCKVELTNYTFDYYPYLDTFQFFDSSSGHLFNYPESSDYYQLNRATGQLEDEPEDDDTEEPIQRPRMRSNTRYYQNNIINLLNESIYQELIFGTSAHENEQIVDPGFDNDDTQEA